MNDSNYVKSDHCVFIDCQISPWCYKALRPSLASLYYSDERHVCVRRRLCDSWSFNPL